MYVNSQFVLDVFFEVWCVQAILQDFNETSLERAGAKVSLIGPMNSCIISPTPAFSQRSFAISKFDFSSSKVKTFGFLACASFSAWANIIVEDPWLVPVSIIVAALSGSRLHIIIEYRSIHQHANCVSSCFSGFLDGCSLCLKFRQKSVGQDFSIVT